MQSSWRRALCTLLGSLVPKLTQYTRYADAQQFASSSALWELFDGDRQCFNIAHECITRHADGTGRTAVRIANADGTDTVLSFDEIASGSARYAPLAASERYDPNPGERIAFMLDPLPCRSGPEPLPPPRHS